MQYRDTRYAALLPCRFVSPSIPKFPTWWEAAQKLTKNGAVPSGLAAKDELARLPKEVAALIKAGGLSAKAVSGSAPLRGAAATA